MKIKKYSFSQGENKIMRKTGLIQIYTGEGKGKTTAAMGLALRAYAQGLCVMYISFHKDPKFYYGGEQKILKKLGIFVKCFAKSHPFCSVKNKTKASRYECLKAIQYIRKIFKKNKVNLLILDELNITVRDGFLKEDEVLHLLNEKPEGLELVLTGRGATKKMIRQADLVSHIKEIKHPFKKGIKARRGIEF
ncbi:MAG: cob(I)yrinic acid a,c-diamide adenosyltransferase [Candidatus Omnitrophota bacterium]